MSLDDRLQQRARVLGDPTRFGILRHIAASSSPVGVAELTEAFGFNHNNVRQHLAALAEEGFVAEFDEARATRGRPRKLYVLRPEGLQGLDVGVTPYQRLADLLLELHRTGESAYDVGYTASLGDGVSGVSAGDLEAAIDQLAGRLRAEGFAPVADEPAGLRLDVCPFAATAGRDQSIVCELHRGLIDGQLRSRESGVRADLIPKEPSVAGCLVRLQRPGD